MTSCVQLNKINRTKVDQLIIFHLAKSLFFPSGPYEGPDVLSFHQWKYTLFTLYRISKFNESLRRMFSNGLKFAPVRQAEIQFTKVTSEVFLFFQCVFSITLALKPRDPSSTTIVSSAAPHSRQRYHTPQYTDTRQKRYGFPSASQGLRLHFLPSAIPDLAIRE